MDSIVSYLKISNLINQKYKISNHQKLFSLNLHNLKLMIDESKIIKLLEASMKELEKEGYIEVRGVVLDNYIKKIMFNIDRIDETLKEFQLQKGILNRLRNMLFNDTFGSLYQFKVELLNRFDCEEVKITTEDDVSLDA